MIHSNARRPRYAPIGEYAIIGDCHGAALIREDASIDWACLTRFDSGGVFCGLLDAKKGGSFSIEVRDLKSVSRRYLPDTNVLETTFVTSTGEARVVDCFAMRRGGRRRPLRQLLRLLEGVRGSVDLHVSIRPRFDYGSLHPRLVHHPRERVDSAVGGDDGLVLSADCGLLIDRERATWQADVSLRARQRVRFALSAAPPWDLDLRRLRAATFDARLAFTIGWWRRWVAQGGSTHPPEVVRSALVLKLLTCAPTGAIIAAPTTSLPELVGGQRNWDYRYSWVRDSTMTLSALLAAGHHRAAAAFKRFIETATAGRVDELQIMYGCYGERRLTESELGHLEGYRRSRPVRVGNDAATQTQLDVFGELLDGARLWVHRDEPMCEEDWRFLSALVEAACRRWREPDRGIWEVRGAPRHFVYSKVMCWLAVSRGIEIAEALGLSAPLGRWRKCRDQIRRDVEQEGVDERRGCFVAVYGETGMDASLLRLPIVGFVAADDPRMLATVEAIRQELGRGPLLHRYSTSKGGGHDGLEGGEGAFLAASFWLVDVLTMAGRVDEAEELYGQLLTLANDVGLYSEEFDDKGREQLGNFPQALTHISLIVARDQIRRARADAQHSRTLADRSHTAPRGRARHARGRPGTTVPLRH